MTMALVYLGGSTLALIVLSFFYRWEDRQGHRVILRRLRAGLDLVCLCVVRLSRRYIRQLSRHFSTVVFGYGLYRLLQYVLRIIQGLETRLQTLLGQQQVATFARPEGHVRNHLDEIADHKAESTLTKGQRSKLLNH